ncbi:PspC domain-containing protein [Winogradskyella maritima]|uniref:PspC domain-containing protein n=1 Tax=Winogradskyella maritima TaxID=1517766 RepID=A0ABV8ALQ6_9FLAO|nr:PspC domain-containing protein [Winogradskyella maritima]
MNKTVNINLAGVFFHIDEDAFLKLQRYLEAIKRSFTDSQGRSEIIADIEARIAELFSERIQNDKQVVNSSLVDEVITIMGQPEDYLVDDEIFEDEPQASRQRRPQGSSKKLYRDTDNSYIGGVSSGLSHYLGIDMVWVRLLWILLALGSGGTFILIYLLFWALVPEARTTSEKLTMTGDPVNISNIEKKIKDGFDSVSDSVKNVDFKKHGDRIKEGFDQVSDNISDAAKKVDFQKQSDRLKSNSKNFFDTFGDVLLFFLKLFAKFIGVILIITGISALIGLIVAFFTVGITNAVHFPGWDFVEASNMANVPIWLMSTLLFFLVAIPFFFVFYIGLRILVNNLKSIGNVAKFALLGVWLMALIGIIVIGVKQATERAIDASSVSESYLDIKQGDTLNLKMVTNRNYSRNFYRNSHGYHITRDDNNEKIISTSDLRLIVRSTTDSVARLEIEKVAYGSNFDIAKERADNINYNYDFANNELALDSYLTTNADNKFSDQRVELILYLPEGSYLYADDNTRSFHRNSSWYNDILDNGQEGHYLEIITDDVICDTCPTDDDDDSIKVNIDINGDKGSLKINGEDGLNISRDSLNISINGEGFKAEGTDVKVKINDQDGVSITTDSINQ